MTTIDLMDLTFWVKVELMSTHPKRLPGHALSSGKLSLTDSKRPPQGATPRHVAKNSAKPGARRHATSKPARPRKLEPRLAAVRVLERVRGGESLTTALPPFEERVSTENRPLLRELCYGVERWRPQLDALLSQQLARPLKPKDRDLYILMELGLYQLRHLRIPSYAAVDATVSTVTALNKPWARGLINGVLRNLGRAAESGEADESSGGDTSASSAEPQSRRSKNASEEQRYAHPQWMIDAIRQDWPEQWQQLLAASNERAPMTLRLHPERSGGVDEYRQQLEQQGVVARPISGLSQALMLERPCDVETLPRFAEGAVSVQDGAGQWAAQLLELEPGQRVMDACAAPGGKSAHILERRPELAELLAIDIDPKRIERLRHNLRRAPASCRVLCADAADPDRWWDGEPFERILLDAPCSATGVIRRHPDIKSLRRPSDITALAERQGELLDRLWPLLAPGGLLLYATCSLFKAENEEQITAFLARTADAIEQPITQEIGLKRPVGRQILTGAGEMDGFYYARLRKKGA